MATLLALGFASGLPVPLVYANLSIWLHDEGVTRTGIGLFALVSLPYAINFLWAPLVDRMKLPYLTARFGRRRGWALLTQAFLFVALVTMSFTQPSVNLMAVAMAALFVTFSSATQDIVIDAYRIDVLEPSQYGAGSAVAIWGWHLGGTLVGGAGGLLIASAFGWPAAYLALSLGILVGVGAILLSPEPPFRPPQDTVEKEREVASLIHRVRWLGHAGAAAVTWLYGAVIAPFAEFMRRRGWLLILLFIVFFKFGDALLGRMSGVFYRELGFDYEEIAEVMKVYGFAANGVGVLLGGVLVAKLGIFRSLLVAGVLAASTNLLYSWLAVVGQAWPVFVTAVVADNFAMGLSSVAFVAYVSGLCNVAYTATQYALLASAGNLGRVTLSASSGWMIDTLHGNWAAYFALTALIAAAALPLVVVMMRKFPEALARAPDKDRA